MTDTRYCDLHVHSCLSDGADTPEKLVDIACAAGLQAIALTDHNTIAGLPEFAAASEKKGLQAVYGCEFSTDYAGKELHILGLFLPLRSWPDVTAYTEMRNRLKALSNRDCCERLAAAGYDISYDDILEKNPGASINRMHISRELMEKGYAASVKEALHQLLQPEQGFFRKPARLDALDTIRRIKLWGGAAVWAHPLLNVSRAEIEVFIPEAKAAGLDGIETLYSLYSPEDTCYMQSISKTHDLLPSGGSDFHGINKPDIKMGVGKGNLRIPLEYLDALAERASKQ